MSVVHVRKLFSSKKPTKPGSVVVITGAASGIGRAVALKYASRKCKLVIADIDEKNLKSVEDACKSNGCQCLSLKVDVTSEADCKKLMDEAIATFHAIDVLVLCAGIGAHHLFEQTTDLTVFKKLMNVNFYGYLHCTTHAYPHLAKSKGLLVAVTSFSGEVGLPYRTAYCASKFAVTGFLEALRAEMNALKQANKFDICIVCPPTVNSNLRKNSIVVSTEEEKEKSSKAPEAGAGAGAGAGAEHALSVEECADAILDAADRRLRKAFFPFNSWLGAYLRPLLPDYVDAKIWRKAML